VKFCSQCAQTVVLRIPPGDNLPRYVCEACGAIHYQNPKIVAGCVPEWEGRILLCRRAIEPRLGLWTLPAGFMENGETTPQAAMREAMEEACASIEDIRLFALYNLPHISQVYIMFRGRLKEGLAAPGPESTQVGLFEEQEIPWDELAFPVIVETLKLYLADRVAGQFRVHTGDIIRAADRSISVRRHA
jgi:ADP-ribose pyrophosphatase YjhB (NUDIX family)